MARFICRFFIIQVWRKISSSRCHSVTFLQLWIVISEDVEWENPFNSNFEMSFPPKISAPKTITRLRDDQIIISKVAQLKVMELEKHTKDKLLVNLRAPNFNY